MISLKRLFKPVKSMEPDKVKKFLAEHKEGTYTLLDVRQPKEYEESHIAGAKLIPLPRLRDSAAELEPDKPVIAYCAIGGRSRVAAQLLSGMGFKEVYNITGGIKAWEGVKAAGPWELNLELLRGDETPSEMTVFAYGMEMGLQGFYTAMNERTDDRELKDLLTRLIQIEENHKKMLFELYSRIEPSGKDLRTFEADVETKIMEGGFNIEEFIKKNEPLPGTVTGIIDLAMMLETQALDLYLRFTDKSANDQAKDVLFKISEEEKAHLTALGRLLEEKI